VWTVDFKGWWWRGHYRCEPLTVRDEYSRYLLELRAVPDARTETLQRSFERLFERHGLPGAIRSDNGSPFASRSAVYGLSRRSAWWVAYKDYSVTDVLTQKCYRCSDRTLPLTTSHFLPLTDPPPPLARRQ